MCIRHYPFKKKNSNKKQSNTKKGNFTNNLFLKGICELLYSNKTKNVYVDELGVAGGFCS